MAVIELPNRQVLLFDSAVSVKTIAESIGPGLLKAALVATVNDQLVDLSFMIEEDSKVAIITEKDEMGLEVLRHSCAHLMAQAVQQLFKDVQVTIGPVVDNGFYYDFDYQPGFSEDDLIKIESKMAEIVKLNLLITREMWSRKQAISHFRNLGEHYKVKIIEDLPEDELLSFYRQGDFIDLCRGPHVPSTAKLKAFKLMRVAGAYWRGDSNNPMLQRIYGTAWDSKKALTLYLDRLKEAKKRDHRKLAQKYDLFHMQDLAPGMVFWHPKGWIVYQEIQKYVRAVLEKAEYQEIKTPQIIDLTLWEQSGHWEKFRENMFSLTVDERNYAIKPMNCPCHVQVFNQGLKSYRDLPLRLAEFGSCHRYEPSGALHGLFRVRHFVQDDAHIFCTESQIQAEVSACIDLVFKMYHDLGFYDIIFHLSTRPYKRVGTDLMWDKAEQALELALKNKQVNYELCSGEGAFYGPKIDFALRDCLNRVWQCATIQVDFSMPERLKAHYIAEDGSKQVPVMIHRAILGSIERLLGILLENTAGSLPVWLAPVQAVMMNITDEQSKYVRGLTAILKEQGFRVKEDLRNEKIGFKIREHTVQRIPYLLVAGNKEQADKTISVRTREGANMGVMEIDKLIDLLSKASKIGGSY